MECKLGVGVFFDRKGYLEILGVGRGVVVGVGSV